MLGVILCVRNKFNIIELFLFKFKNIVGMNIVNKKMKKIVFFLCYVNYLIIIISGSYYKLN